MHTGTTNFSLVHNLLSDKPSVSESVKIYKLYHNGALNASKRTANDARDSSIPPLSALQSTTETAHGRKS